MNFKCEKSQYTDRNQMYRTLIHKISYLFLRVFIFNERSNKTNLCFLEHKVNIFSNILQNTSNYKKVLTNLFRFVNFNFSTHTSAYEIFTVDSAWYLKFELTISLFHQNIMVYKSFFTRTTFKTIFHLGKDWKRTQF